MREVKGVLKWRHAVHREIRENKAERHSGEGVILTGIRGKRNVVTSRSTAEKILERFLKSAKEKDGLEKKRKKKKKKKKKIIQIAAKVLPLNFNKIETSKEYASGAKVADLAANLDCIPPSLLVVVFCLFFCCCCCRGRKNLKSK